MNEQTPLPTPEVEPEQPASGIAQDLRSMGEKLAAMIKAATGTPEAEVVKSDMRQGMVALRQEIDKALQRVPTTDVQSGVQKSGEVAAGATQRLRGEAATLLREANRALDKLADALQGQPGEPTPDMPADDRPAEPGE